jgi:hypothetical protein
MEEGDRIHSTVVAELSRVGDADLERRQGLYELLRDRRIAYEAARREAEDYYEDQRAQARLARTCLLWARSLHEDGTGKWYSGTTKPRAPGPRAGRPRARPSRHSGDQRESLEELGTRIDRALTPWPIL